MKGFECVLLVVQHVACNGVIFESCDRTGIDAIRYSVVVQT